MRPGHQRLLADVRAGRIEVVLAEGLDRLSRDQEHTAAPFKQLAFAGVRLVTVAEGEVGELHVRLKGTMNGKRPAKAAWAVGLWPGILARLA